MNQWDSQFTRADVEHLRDRGPNCKWCISLADRIEARLSNGPTAPEDPLLPNWLPTWLDKNLLISAMAFLAAHHQKQMDEAQRDADNDRNKLAWRTIAQTNAKHHQEQLYLIGEQLALLGGNNGWPRPARELAVDPAVAVQ